MLETITIAAASTVVLAPLVDMVLNARDYHKRGAIRLGRTARPVRKPSEVPTLVTRASLR